MTARKIEDPVTILVEGRSTGWWVVGWSSKAHKEWGPYDMHKALKIQRQLVRKFKAEGRM